MTSTLFTHVLMATWTEEGKELVDEYDNDVWLADLSDDRLYLEGEANRRNADRGEYRYVRYWVEPIEGHR